MNLFIDTNIFLSFYHLSSDDLEEIHKLAILLDKGEVKLFLPEQIKDEFKRNRENKISDALKKLKEQAKKTQFPQICKDYAEYSDIQNLQKEFNRQLSILIDKLTNDIKEINLKADKKIMELFDKAIMIETSPELIAKAKFRMDVRNPPGKNGSLGDAINWEALLEVVPNGEELHLVADDKDYYSVLDNNILKDFLSNEWNNKKDSKIKFYRRLSQFFKEHYPDIKLATELEKEFAIKDLVNSKSFAKTHLAIAQLSKYAEFSKAQSNELVQAAINNSQVNWILCDSDILEFYQSLISNYSDYIDDTLLENLKKEIVACIPEDDDT